MTTIINPVFDKDPLDSTVYRFNSLFKPIQKTRNKQSDFIAYVATPVLDYFVLDTLFALDISIRLTNAIASLLKAAYIWTLEQQDSHRIIDKDTRKELKDFTKNIEFIVTATIAQIMNIFLSSLCLVTRPIASVVELANENSAIAPGFRR